MEGNTRRTTIIILLILTAVLASVSVFVGWKLSQEDQAPEESEAGGGYPDTIGCENNPSVCTDGNEPDNNQCAFTYTGTREGTGCADGNTSGWHIGGWPDGADVNSTAPIAGYDQCKIGPNPCGEATGYDAYCICGDTGDTGEYPITIKGSAYCEEDGKQYPLPGIKFKATKTNAVWGETAKYSDTTGTGGNFKMEFTDLRWGGYFDVEIENIPDKILEETGQSYSEMVLSDTYCDEIEQTDCKVDVDPTLSCSETADGYEKYTDCRITRGPKTADNFVFVFSNCSAGVTEEAECGDECSADTDCPTDHECYGDACVLSECLEEGVECSDDMCTVVTTGGLQCLQMDTNSNLTAVGEDQAVIFDVIVGDATTDTGLTSSRLRVTSTSDNTPVGEDYYNPGNAVVRPHAVVPTDTEGQWRIIFVWVATGMTDGDYEVEFSLNGTTWSTVTACMDDLTYSDTAEVNSNFIIVKTSEVVSCSTSGAIIDYDLTLTNLGPDQGVIDYVEDELDSGIQESWVSNITSSRGIEGVLSSGTIRWTGTATQRTYAADASSTFSYRITIPASSLSLFTDGVSNIATVVFGDDQNRYNLLTDLSCAGTLPSTGIVDQRPWIIGITAIIIGLIALRLGAGHQLLLPILNTSKQGMLQVGYLVGLDSMVADSKKKEMEERWNEDDD